MNGTLLNRIDRLQRRIVSCVYRVPMRDGEENSDFHRRRMRAVSLKCREMNLWSEFAAKRVVAWYSHCRRAHLRSWASELLAASHREWLIARRLQLGSKSAYGGCTGTRCQRGPPRTRYEDGVEHAREIVCGL